MATAIKDEPHSDAHNKPYLEVFIGLAVLTVIEVILGTLIDTGPVKIIVLMTLAFLKAAAVAAIFMHVRYEKDPRLIVIFAFILPLIGALLLTLVILSDYRG